MKTWLFFCILAAPYFISVNDGPHDVNVTNGDDVVINCNAYANPDASVVWYLNGVEFDSENIFFKKSFVLERAKLKVTLRNCLNNSDIEPQICDILLPIF